MNKYKNLVLEAIVDTGYGTAIINLYKSGRYTIDELAQQFNLSPQIVRKIIRQRYI